MSCVEFSFRIIASPFLPFAWFVLVPCSCHRFANCGSLVNGISMPLCVCARRALLCFYNQKLSSPQVCVCVFFCGGKARTETERHEAKHAQCTAKIGLRFLRTTDCSCWQHNRIDTNRTNERTKSEKHKIDFTLFFWHIFFQSIIIHKFTMWNREKNARTLSHIFLCIINHVEHKKNRMRTLNLWMRTKNRPSLDSSIISREK